jgi:hypothetical protein
VVKWVRQFRAGLDDFRAVLNHFGVILNDFDAFLRDFCRFSKALFPFCARPNRYRPPILTGRFVTDFKDLRRFLRPKISHEWHKLNTNESEKMEPEVKRRAGLARRRGDAEKHIIGDIQKESEENGYYSPRRVRRARSNLTKDGRGTRMKQGVNRALRVNPRA